MAYSAPFATTGVDDAPPWHKEQAWSFTRKFGRVMSDVCLDGAGYHSGYMNYNSVHETPSRLKKRMAIEKTGLSGSIVWPRPKVADWSDVKRQLPRCVAPESGAVSRVPTSRSDLAMSQTRSAPSPPLARSSSAPGLTLGADGLGLVAPSPLRKEDTFLGMYRDRDRRHADWNVNVAYRDMLGDELCVANDETRQHCILQIALSCINGSLPYETLAALEKIKSARNADKLLYTLAAVTQGNSLIELAKSVATKKMKQNADETSLVDCKRAVQAWLDVDQLLASDFNCAAWNSSQEVEKGSEILEAEQVILLITYRDWEGDECIFNKTFFKDALTVTTVFHLATDIPVSSSSAAPRGSVAGPQTRKREASLASRPPRETGRGRGACYETGSVAALALLCSATVPSGRLERRRRNASLLVLQQSVVSFHQPDTSVDSAQATRLLQLPEVVRHGAFRVEMPYPLMADQPRAVEQLTEQLGRPQKSVALLKGATGTGKTCVGAQIIHNLGCATLIICPNKTLAGQNHGYFQEVFPHNRVELFQSPFDSYRPAYVDLDGKEHTACAMMDAKAAHYRFKALHALVHAKHTGEPVIIVASISCIYDLGASPKEFCEMSRTFEVGDNFAGAKEFVQSLRALGYRVAPETGKAPGYTFKLGKDDDGNLSWAKVSMPTGEVLTVSFAKGAVSITKLELANQEDETANDRQEVMSYTIVPLLHLLPVPGHLRRDLVMKIVLETRKAHRAICNFGKGRAPGWEKK
ncbi:unnamed protein product, partial [Polarella glacialis]